MRSKGFTLIELLAVIVILAIVALIATPVVLNIIEDSRESSAIISANHYKSAVELALSRKVMNDTSFKVADGEYSVMTDGNICLGTYNGGTSCDNILAVEVDGERPTSGTIHITNNKLTKIVELNIANELVSTSSDNSSMVIAYNKWDGVSATALNKLQKDDVAKTVSVNSAADLAGVRNAVNSGNLAGYNIKLYTSIDLAGYKWTPIGVTGVNSYKTNETGDVYFTGTINGNGYTIKGLNVEEDTAGTGFIGGAVGDVTIENLVIEGTVTGNGKSAGGLIGFVKDYNGVASNLTVKNSVIDIDVTSIDSLGGITGRMYGTGTVTIDGVKNTGNITADIQTSGEGKVGGLIGINGYGTAVTITDSQNEGELVGGDFVAGAIGYVTTGNISITRFVNNGAVTSNAYGGGVLGYAAQSSVGTITIDNSINNANITATQNTAGIAANILRDITVTNSTNNGIITSNERHAGGIIGTAGSEINVSNCTNNGSVRTLATATTLENGVNPSAGGIIGNGGSNIILINNNGGSAAITTASAWGKVGRIAGYCSNYTTENVSGNTGLDDIPLFAMGVLAQS